MKAQNGLKFPSELCFGIINVTKDSYWLNSKVQGLIQVVKITIKRVPFSIRMYFDIFIKSQVA